MLRIQASHQGLSPPMASTSSSSIPRCPNWRSKTISMRIGESLCVRARWSSRCPNWVKASMSGGRERRDEEKERWNVDGEFLQASVLVPETLRHYNLLRQGFLEETKWHTSTQLHPVRQRGPDTSTNSIGFGFLRKFQNPTIFLKIACDGDLLLPVVVGELAIEKFLESLTISKNEGCPSQPQFMKNLVGVLGHEVRMVQITKRVINTYYASIILGKPAEVTYLTVDSRPSDALIVANAFKVPIYVSKDIVFRDAIKILYGTWRRSGAKAVYDVLLDSAIDGHDFLSEELDFLQKMNSAVNEERYKDAAIWRDKLTKLRMPKQDL